MPSTLAKLSPSPVSSTDVYKSALRPVMETNLADLGSVNLAGVRQVSESGGRKSDRVLIEGRLSPVPETSQKLTDLGRIPPDASQSTVPAQSQLAATWQTNNPSRQNPARAVFEQQNPTGSTYERQNPPNSVTYNAQTPSSSIYKGDLEQVPSSHHQVILLGPHSLPETLDSLEKVLSNGPNSIEGREVGLDKVGAIAKPSQSSAIPSKEEILSIIGISKQPTSIKKTLSSLDKVSSKKEEKKKMLAALKERAKQSNINYNKPQQMKGLKKGGDGDGATAFQTIYNPVTGRPLGLVSSGDGSFFPVSLPGSVGGVSPSPFHPREHNLLAATTDEFHMLKQVHPIKLVIKYMIFIIFREG